MTSILYVDDEPALLEVARLFLEAKWDFSVDTITSATEALQLMETKKYDAIISDYQMPDMDGIGFLKRVRSTGSSVPFIIFTGRGREEIVIQALNEGADFYLQKGGEPVSQFAELAHKVRQAIRERQAQASIRDHEQREEDIINFLPDATFAIDRSGRIIAWNRAIEDMTGVPAADMLGKGDYAYALPFYGKRRPILIDLIFEPDEVIYEKYAHIIRERNVLIAETNLPLPRGKPALLMGKASPLYNRHGEVVGAIESIRDITAMKKAEERLRESEGQFAAFMDHLPVTAFIKDDQFTNLFVNRRMEEIFGAQDWIGHTVFELFPRKAAEKMVEDDRLTLKEGYRKAVEHLTGTDGRRRIFETHKFRIDRGEKPPLIGGFAIDITEKKEAEDALFESESRFRELSDLLPQMVYEAGLDGRVTYANHIAFKRFGYTEEDLRKGINILQAFVPADRDRVMHAFRALIGGTGTTPSVEEYRALQKDGGTFPVSIYSSPIVKDGRINGIRGIIVDITERKRAEEAVSRSEAQLRAILESTADGILAVDNQGKTLHTSRRFAEIWKIPSEVVASGDDRTMLEFVRDQLADPDTFIAKVESLYRSDEVAMDTLLFKDGRVVERYSFPMMMDGDRFGRVWSFRDVTGQKQVEQALRESEDRLSTILNAAQVGFVLVDAKTHRILQANPKALSLIGGQECDVTGAVCHRFICPAEEGNCPVTDLGQAVNSSERVLITREGVRIPIIKTVVRARIGGKDVLVESFIDISDRKRAEEALTRANTKLGLLATVTRHDIRNQLTALQGFLELSAEGKNPEAMQDYVRKALGVAGVIDRQILFTKDYQAMGMKEPLWQPVGALVKKAEGQFPHPGVSISTEVPGLEVYADPLLEKVLYNLVDNALRYGGPSMKSVRVSFHRDGTDLFLIFEDDGIGIPEAEKELVFTRGFGHNSGLGLFLIREILAITGATITENGVPGRGARFEIRVPGGAWRVTGTE
ncbi:MAG TPA: PAS domain S-box protein [Methanoregula sp.]|nr:PAS domain S-box protein [Methanoregula sp.]